MSTGIVKRFTGTLSLLLIIFIRGYSQDADMHSVRLMFYNTENLFDIYDDELTDDEEFLPGGPRRWNFTRYNKKINALSKVILAAGEWDTPALVGLCEVENRRVLEDLIYSTGLSGFDFGIIHENSQDKRGIDVCLIYRKDLVNVISYSYMKPSLPGGREFNTRSVLFVKLKISDDTLNVFLNHWPSRRGGVLASEDLRTAIAKMVREKADSIAAGKNGKIRYVMMGDFNCTPADNVIRLIGGDYVSGLSMINLSERITAGAGTYRYQGVWEIIDQVLVSGFLTDTTEHIYTRIDLCRIFDAGFLLMDDAGYPGKRPFPTYLGYKYLGGFSDHLPVLLDLKIRR